MSAISLYAKPSPDFAQKLAHSLALIQDRRRRVFAADAGLQPGLRRHGHHAPDASKRALTTRAPASSCSTPACCTPKPLALIGRIEERYPFKVDVYHPDADAASAFVEENGAQAMYKSLALRKQCCHIRKMEPLERALAGKKGWMTGLRREQSAARAEVHDIEQQPERAKINPLVEWTQGDIWHYIAVNAIPYNPLHDQFFPSIGCAPCTRAVTLGEDFRSGRWWWENESAKECGLHVAADGTHEAQEPAAFEPLSSIIPIREIPA